MAAFMQAANHATIVAESVAISGYALAYATNASAHAIASVESMKSSVSGRSLFEASLFGVESIVIFPQLVNI